MSETLSTKQYWEHVYQEKSPLEVSWFQTEPEMSLQLIKATGIKIDQRIIDVGGGASILVDYLLKFGFSQLSVLDISAHALQYAQMRLGKNRTEITWIEDDITSFQPPHTYELWHDRAVFHFLTKPEERKQYVRVLKKALAPKGHVIIASFAINGPKKCSGLDIVQYDKQSLCAELGNSFELLEVHNELHLTPTSAEQKFTYFRFRKKT